MGLEVRVEGGARLRSFAAHLHAASAAGLGKEMAAGLRKATKPIQASIRDEWDKVGPSSGGYRALLSKSLRFRNSIRNTARDASVTLTTFADGKTQRRDIGALEAGKIRHPVFGHRRRAWTTTSIRPGFHKRGTETAALQAEREMRAVLDGFAARLTDG